VAAERLFIPADPVFTSQLAGCSVRMGAGQDGLLALSSVQLPGGGYKPILVIVITWTETELVQMCGSSSRACSSVVSSWSAGGVQLDQRC
jgi:hypothetical protein